MKNRDDLSMAYTPGVGRVSMALYENPDDVWRLTVKGNSVAVVTDGSAVLGLGNIGPGAALPVMEGKAALFKRFANIDAWPICLASQDTDEIVRAVEMIAPGFGGINLEDIAAPRCFEIEARLRASLDIPVFHDDQHGTAIVVLAALTNALRCVKKEIADAKVVVAGGGAAGSAIVALLMAGGVRDVVVWDREGLLSADDDSLPPAKAELAASHQPAPAARRAARRAAGRRRVHRRQRPRRARTRVDRGHGALGGRLRAGQPRPRGRPGGGGEVRRRGRQRPIGLPQPDQQRAGVPGRLPRPARRPRLRDHHRHAAARGGGDRARRQGRRAQPQLHHPVGLQPRGAQGGGGGDPRRATRRTLTPMAVRETRLLLLGAVAMFEPVNGYQIRRELVSWRVDKWAHVNPGSIYHGLSALTAEGYLTRNDLVDGTREVAVYEVTPAGRALLEEMMVEALESVDPYDRTVFTIAFGMLPLLEPAAGARGPGHPAGRPGAGGGRVRARQGRPRERPAARAPRLGAVARPGHRRAGLAARDDRGGPQREAPVRARTRTGAGSRRPTTRATR